MPIDFVTLALAKQMISGDGSEGGSVKIDTTLTQRGFAADAKAVGEALSKKLSNSELSTAINSALTKAKESGEFDGDKGDKGENGADGKTPVKGTDYYTEADKAEMVNTVLAALPTWTGGSY